METKGHSFYKWLAERATANCPSHTHCAAWEDLTAAQQRAYEIHAEIRDAEELGGSGADKALGARSIPRADRRPSEVEEKNGWRQRPPQNQGETPMIEMMMLMQMSMVGFGLVLLGISQP